MGFKMTKIAVASLMLASLTACTANRGADVRNTVGPRNTSTGDLRTLNDRTITRNYDDRLTYHRANDLDRRDYINRANNVGQRDNLNRINNFGDNTNRINDIGGTDNRFMTMDGFNNNYAGNFGSYGWSTANSTAEIQPMGNGFITIAPNSYSTNTPSHQYPHTQTVHWGNNWYYNFVPANKGQGANIPQQSRYSGITPGQTGQTVPKAAAPKTTLPSTTAQTGISQMARQVIDLTNVERKKNGLPPLQADAALSRVAQTKTNDMGSKHYFSHTSPTYGSPFDMMRDFGIAYKSAGENIAMGQTTAQQVVQAWMNSEGHRKNILSPNYTNIGVGFTSNGNYWSQMFIGK